MTDSPRRRPAEGPQPKPKKRAPKASSPAAQANAKRGTGTRKPQARGNQRSSARATTHPTRRRPPTSRGTARPGRTRFERFLRTILLVGVLVLVAIAVTGCAVYSSIAGGLPDPDIGSARGRDQSTVITDRNGKTLARLYAEENRQDVALEDIPVHVRQAVIATEDKRFYEHEGVDPLGIARALVVDITRGEKAQGGSTITQQYVKQAFVTSEKTLKRKAQEAILAQRVERRYSKDEILGLYLNTIYFGHGSYGIEAASRAYFGKSVKKLSVAEGALLAGVVKSPGRYSPYLDEEAGLGRRNVVLKQMRDQGYIDEATYAEAVATEIELEGLKPISTRAPYFVEWVKNDLAEEYGSRTVYRGGLRVKTTLDLSMQRSAEKAIAAVLDQKGDPSAALVAMRPDTGEIVAMVGGSDFTEQQFNVAVQGLRQPGSAFKPFVLATALTEGVSPEKAFPSGPRSFTVSGETWKVTGASGSKDATMRLRPATEKSVNSVFAQLILDVGAEDVIATAETLGLHKGIEPVPAIALGGLEEGVSPLEMARAYGTLANGGRRTTPYGVALVKDASGETLKKAKPSSKTAIDPAVAYLTTDILKDVIEHGTGTAAQIGRPAAGKTGTTQQYRDAWFVGYTPDLVCAVWVGYPESQRSMDSVHGRAVTGGSFPAEIWARFMTKALEDEPAIDFQRPTGLASVKLCSETGGKATEFCPETVMALTLAEFPPADCTEHTEPVKIKAPNVVGLTQAQAVAALKKADLRVVIEGAPASGAQPGKVVSQSPAAGKKVELGTKVTIVVATDTETNAPPQPVIEGPSAAEAGEKVTFDAATSTDDGEIVRFLWEFGDGQTATGTQAKHAWDSPGLFELTLWVTDDSGAQASITRQITVR